MADNEAGGRRTLEGIDTSLDRPVEPRVATLVDIGNNAIADPAGLGLAGFAMTTVLLSLVNSGAIESGAASAVLPLALLYGGTAQLLAGMWEFRNRNTFGAVAFSSYGAFWISFYVLLKFWLPGLSAGEAHGAVGFYLLMWGIFTFYMWIASFRTDMVVWFVFLTLWMAFGLLAAGALGGETGAYHMVYETGGYVGLVCGSAAWYRSFAGVTNATFHSNIIPVGPLGARTLGFRRGVPAQPVSTGRVAAS